MMCVLRITVSHYGCGMGEACKVSVFMRVFECVVGAYWHVGIRLRPMGCGHHRLSSLVGRARVQVKREGWRQG